MSTERRQQARKVPKDFTYIRVGEDSGGRVLNVSEQGLCFEALSPIRYTESFPFWLSFNLIDRIDGEGTVVWVDTAKRTAGIRFMDLSEFARDQIRSWMDESATEEAAPALEGQGPEVIELPLGGSEVAELPLSALQSPAPVSHADVAMNAPETPREFAEPAEPALAGEDERVDWESEPAGVSAGYSELSELVPLRRYLTTARMQFVRGILVGVGVGAVIVLPLFKYMSLRQRDASAVEIGATTSTVNAGSLTDAQAPKPVLDVPASWSLGSNGTRVRTNGSSQSRGNSGDPVFGRQNARTPGSSAGAPGGPAAQPSASVPQNIQPAAPATAGVSGAENTRAADPPSATPAENNRQPASAANRAAATQRADESSGTVTASTVNPGTPVASSGAASAEVRRGAVAPQPPLGGDVRPPKLVKSITPGYPPLARTQRVSGDVQVDALVDATGKVETVKILSGPLLLHRAAADAIRQWKYAPGMLDGTATPMHVTVILKFRIPTQ